MLYIRMYHFLLLTAGEDKKTQPKFSRRANVLNRVALFLWKTNSNYSKISSALGGRFCLLK